MWLDNLRDPQRALAAVEAAARSRPTTTRSDCALLERIIEAPNASKSVREAALDLLRSHYDASNRARAR